jgi:ATP dependent DNA ligase domain
MAPTRVREPFHRDGWVYEEKVDGGRSLAYKDHARVRLISRNGRDHTRRFPEIAGAVAKLSARYLVLDGEIAIYDQQLRSSLMRSIERVGLLNPIIVTERGRLVIGAPARSLSSAQEVGRARRGRAHATAATESTSRRSS